MGGPHNMDCSTWGSISGSPFFRNYRLGFRAYRARRCFRAEDAEAGQGANIEVLS